MDWLCDVLDGVKEYHDWKNCQEKDLYKEVTEAAVEAAHHLARTAKYIVKMLIVFLRNVFAAGPTPRAFASGTRHVVAAFVFPALATTNRAVRRVSLGDLP